MGFIYGNHLDCIEPMIGITAAYEYAKGLFTDQVTVEKRRDKLHGGQSSPLINGYQKK